MNLNFKSLLLILLLSIGTQLFASDINYYNLKVGDKININDNDNYNIEKKTYKPIILKINHKKNWRVKKRKNKIYQTIMPYVLYGKYKKGNDEKKDFLTTTGFYYSLYNSELPYWTFNIDPEFTKIKKTDKSSDINQFDLTFSISKYNPLNKLKSTLTFHYTHDNKKDKIIAGQFKIDKFITKYKNYKYYTTDFYTKFDVEKYRFFNYYTGKSQKNLLLSIKPGVIFTVPIKTFYIKYGIEGRITKQNKNKKFLNTNNNYMKGIKLNFVLGNYKNIWNLSTYFGDEIGTVDNNGYLINNNTSKNKSSYKIKYTRIINKTTSISTSYSFNKYQILSTKQNNNLQIFNIMVSKSF